MTQREPEELPEGGYGWVCVATCFTANCFTWGIVSSYGVFLAYYLSTNHFPGSQPRDYAFIGGFNFGFSMLCGPFVTVLARKYSMQCPMIIGAFFLSGGFISASFASRIWHLYLSQGVLVGLGVGFIYIPSVPVLSQWFSRKRSLANGISAAGSGIGGLIFSLSTGPMIRNIGLAWSLRIIGIIAFVTNMCATIFIRDRNASIRPAQLAIDGKLLKRTDVQLLLAWAFISMLGYITLLFSLSDYAKSVGFDQTQAYQITAFLNLGTAFGRPLIGILSDRFGRLELAGGATLLCGVAVLAIWIPASSFGVVVFFSLLSGAILGVYWVTIGPICVEIAELQDLQSLLSLSWLSTVLPTMFSEVIALELRRSQSKRVYLYPQLFCGLSYICASFCLLQLWLQRRPKLVALSTPD